ncbi:MAG: HAD family hydrolase [Clostridia bacterium]|nr:HAD family hydrolase [Clostridia bacterium]
MNKKYGFFLDIDNTLYSHGKIPHQNIEAIEYVRSKGHAVFINTARSFANVPEIVKNLSVDGFITSMGCSIVINGKKVLSVSFDTKEIAAELDYITSFNMKCIIEGESMLIGNKFYKGNGKFPTVKDGKELLERFGSEKMPKVYIEGILPKECMENLSKKHTVFQHGTYAEYAVEGYDKASGMFFAAEKCGVAKENCVAMGDSSNDLAMLKAAGISVAMGNSIDEVKAVCDFVTSDAADGGVAEAMMKIIS